VSIARAVTTSGAITSRVFRDGEKGQETLELNFAGSMVAGISVKNGAVDAIFSFPKFLELKNICVVDWENAIIYLLKNTEKSRAILCGIAGSSRITSLKIREYCFLHGAQTQRANTG
jgi:hypothetical protein